MNLIALRCFVEAARTLNLTAAAERVFLTQPTLSRRIAELENEFGTQLFVRTGRGLELTEKGMQLLHQAQAILNLVEETKRTMKAGDDLTGDLTIDARKCPPSTRWLGHLHDCAAPTRTCACTLKARTASGRSAICARGPHSSRS